MSIIASARLRPPPLTRSSRTESNAPESERPPSIVGPSSAWSASVTPSFSVTSMRPSRASIQLELPLRVLISPLCPIMCSGCARSQLGNVFVEKRLCTKDRYVVKFSSWRSGKYGITWSGLS